MAPQLARAVGVHGPGKTARSGMDLRFLLSNKESVMTNQGPFDRQVGRL